MPTIRYTRTVNPLQFDALEPKRFEDLVRQLLYDFRVWRMLEPTGRMGGDDGFDARGWETNPEAIDFEDVISEDERPSPYQERIWLVQCKREQTITPKKLKGYLDAIAAEEVAQLHGVILAACADFSKLSRDVFRAWCMEKGVREFYLWGKAELEDALFQPKNDHLLFAYFGLSLTIRRRSEQARLRSQTTIKRKLKRALDNNYEILLRDISEINYPYSQGKDEFGWWVCAFPKLTFRGLECTMRKYFAYIDDDGVHWDYANVINDAALRAHSDPWRGSDEEFPGRDELLEFWSSLPRQNRAWLTVWGVMPFPRILEVDEIGDDVTEHPHVYVEARSGESRPFESEYPELKLTDQWGQRPPYPEVATRVEKFPSKFRKPLPPIVIEAAGLVVEMGEVDQYDKP